MTSSPSILVVGGGVAGLAAAYKLRKRGRQVILWEKSNRVGGQVLSVRHAGLTVELGASKTLEVTSPALDLIYETGLSNKIKKIPKERLWIRGDGKIVPIPESCTQNGLSSLRPILNSPALGWGLKCRGAIEPLFIKSASMNDISTFNFFSERFGQRITDKLVAPVTWGLTGSSPKKQSLQCFSPEFWKLWQDSRSILLQGLCNPVRVPNMCCLADGWSQLVNTMSKSIKIIHNCKVNKVKIVARDKFIVTGDNHEITVHGIVLAIPDSEVSCILRDELNYRRWPFDQISDNLTTVLALYEIDDYHPENFGLEYVLENPKENSHVRMANISGVNTRTGKALLRVVGISDTTTPNLLAETIEKMNTHAQLFSKHPVKLIKLISLPKTVVREGVGHRERVSSLRNILPDGIVLAGSYYDGGGLNSSIASGFAAAEQISKRLDLHVI